MGTTVSALYESTKEKYRLCLHGGAAGLKNTVHWIYLTEDIQNIPFLKGDELVITTGLFTQSGVTLSDFIRSVALYNGSGILLNTGKYLQTADITGDIVACCDSCGLPLLSMPWEVHLVDIMQDCAFLLMQNIQGEELLSATLQNALYQEPVQENALRLLARFGFAAEEKYRFFAIQNIQNPVHVTALLNARGLKYKLFPHENIWVMLWAVPEGKPSLEEVVDMLCYCDSVRVGVGDVTHSLAGISRSYKRARFALAAAALWQRRSVVFEESGVFQILFDVPDPKRLSMFMNRYLGELVQYDMVHHSDYLATLRTYLMCDGSILETSRRMYTHRNTIVYRIGRIRELLNTDLNDTAVRFNLLLAFYIREFLTI